MSKAKLKTISGKLKKASQAHAGQAKQLDEVVSAMPLKKSSALKKISAACKAAAKRKFKVWPSAYASGWGVRCTRAGGPSRFGGGKKKKKKKCMRKTIIHLKNVWVSLNTQTRLMLKVNLKAYQLLV